MKKIVFTFTAVALTMCFAACNNGNPDKNTGEKDSSAVMSNDSSAGHAVGNDSDEHGCKGSAGYTWSEVKNNCVRLFETGIALNAAGANDSTMSAYVIMSDDQMKAEVFTPSEKGMVLEKKDKADAAWVKDNYKLGSAKGEYTLYKDGKPAYTGKASK